MNTPSLAAISTATTDALRAASRASAAAKRNPTPETRQRACELMDTALALALLELQAERATVPTVEIGGVHVPVLVTGPNTGEAVVEGRRHLVGLTGAGWAAISDTLEPLERSLTDLPLAEVLRRLADDRRATVRPGAVS